MDKIDLPPRPSSLIESMRDIGYSLETAIADIIDNSITAKAENIHVRFSWNNGAPWLAIIDDGDGMKEAELINAMRFGSMNPLQIRDEYDLGRFGLGLKTASFSQCRCLTVLTKKDNKIKGARWDLDLISSMSESNWSLSVFDLEELEKIDKNQQLLFLNKEYLEVFSSGTIVIWNKLDRLEEDTPKMSKESQFNAAINSVRKHLELVFHRFLAPKAGHSKIRIFLNEGALEAFDPYNTLKATELRSEEFLYEDARITVQPYILPHHNKVSKTEWQKYAGNRGYLHEQGFYVYRNRRLIIYGTWFRLIRKDELTKLLRVKVDIPNSLDHLWRIDVKKSNAFPPAGIREGLKRIVNQIEFAGKRVYKQRGQRLTSDSKIPGWNRIAKENQIYYEINKEHPLIEKYINNLDGPSNTLFSNILDMLESSFPRESYYNDIATDPENVSVPKLDKEKIKDFLDFFINEQKGMPDKNSLHIILQTEPFASNQATTKLIFSERGYEY